MKKLIVAATALSGFLALTGSAIAADPVVDPTYDWTGFYIGANAGYGWEDGGSTNLSTDDITPTNLGDATAPSRGTIGSFDADGEIGGLQAGYNLQSGMIVFGAEGDIQGSGINDELSGTFTNPFGAFPIDGTASLDLNWLGTVRGRVGASFDPLLLYATGGVAFGDIDYTMHAFETGGPALFESTLKSSDTEIGYVAGAGAEYAIDQNWSTKLEYQYINLGNISAKSPVTNLAGGLPTGETARTDIDAEFHTVRIGLNYKF